MAKRSGCPAKGKPPPSNTFLHCVCADVSLTPRPAQAQRRRAGDHRVEFDEESGCRKAKTRLLGGFFK
ncbi:hypothetical protein F2980_26015 [Klebsiella quasipneumoniae subsp. quasipneumoniae]|nr:hypothetical protein F2980_26015 [Klebsiella quasipneumoniae subsp. quasipneumoniae]